MAYVRTSRGAVTRIGNPYSRGSSNYNSRQAYINANRVSAPSSGSSSGGGSTTTREAVYRSVPVYRTVFDQAGYDKYVKEETGRAIKMFQARLVKNLVLEIKKLVFKENRLVRGNNLLNLLRLNLKLLEFKRFNKREKNKLV